MGWHVRYQVADGPPAGFAPQGGQVAEVEVNPAGQANAELFQPSPAPGTNRIAIQIFRPAGPGVSPLAIASGMTLSTWTAPQIAIHKTGPAAVGTGACLKYQVTVSNPGDLPAEDVVVTDEIPAEMAFVGSNPPGQPAGRQLRWPLGRVGPRETRTLEVSLRAERRGSATSCAEAAAGGGLHARDCLTTTIAPPTIEVVVHGPNVGRGRQPSGLRDRSDQSRTTPACGLRIRDGYDPGLLNEAGKNNAIEHDLAELARAKRSGRWWIFGCCTAAGSAIPCRSKTSRT